VRQLTCGEALFVVEHDSARPFTVTAGDQLSGIFDADRPQALMLYAVKNEALAVEPDGKDWVIRVR